MPELSVIIPARNEPYLQNTIDEIFLKSRADTDVIAVLDGYWPDPPLKDDDRLHIIHYGESRGLRNAVKSAVEMSRAEHIYKLDAHCMLDEGFDVKLMADCEPNWVVVPRRKRLLAETWEEEVQPGRPDIDYEFLSWPYGPKGHSTTFKADENYGLHGIKWDALNKREDLKDVLIDDKMTAQGSSYFMHKDYFNELELLDESVYGTFRDEFLEVGMKCWLSGGRVVVNKKTWYAHWHKKRRGYSLPQEDSAWEIWMKPNAWHKQTLPMEWFIKHFADKYGGVPGWSEEYYNGTKPVSS